MDNETQSTQLCIYFNYAERTGKELSDNDVEFVKSLLKKHGLYYDHYDKHNINTGFFVDSDENMEKVNEIEDKIKEYFDEFNVERYTMSDEIYGSEPGTYQTWLDIK
jgi:hypothetical protein